MGLYAYFSYIYLFPADSLFTFHCSWPEWWRGQSNRWQEEKAHPGLNPKPTLQRLSGLCRTIWGKKKISVIQISFVVKSCCWEVLTQDSNVLSLFSCGVSGGFGWSDDVASSANCVSHRFGNRIRSPFKLGTPRGFKGVWEMLITSSATFIYFGFGHFFF